MLQNLAYALSKVTPLVVDAGLCSVTATFQQPDGQFGPSGAPSGNYTDVAGMTNLTGMAAPPAMSTIQATEVKAMADILAQELLHLWLPKFYPQLDDGWRNGWRCVLTFLSTLVVNYDILGVESDSQEIMTRVHLRLSTV